MSLWHEAKKEDLEIDGDEINIYSGFDDSGNRYVTVKILDIKELLEHKKSTPKHGGCKKWQK